MVVRAGSTPPPPTEVRAQTEQRRTGIAGRRFLPPLGISHADAKANFAKGTLLKGQTLWPFERNFSKGTDTFGLSEVRTMWESIAHSGRNA